MELKEGTILQKKNNKSLTGKVIQNSGDSVLLWVLNSENNESADLWYTKREIEKYWNIIDNL